MSSALADLTDLGLKIFGKKKFQKVLQSKTWIRHISSNYLRSIYIVLDIISNPEKAMAPHSSTLAWKIPWAEEPGGLQSMGSRRVGHDWATWLSLFTFMHWRRKWQPTPCSCLENPRDGGAWWAAVYGVAQSRTRLKWLNSSSSQETNSLRRTMQIVECSLLHQRAQGRVSS